MENVINMDIGASEPLTEQDMVNLFMGLFRLVKRQYQSTIDALRAQVVELETAMELKKDA